MALRGTMNRGRARNTGGYSDFRGRSWHRGGPSAHRHSPVSWSPPAIGWFKLNSDGSVLGNLGQASASAIIRDHWGKWVKGCSRSFGCTDSMVAELWGLRDGLLLAVELNIRRLEIELDAAPVIDLIKNEFRNRHPLYLLLSECRSLLSKIKSVNINHIFREANSCADSLAKEVGEDRPFADGTFGCADGTSRGRGNNSLGCGSKHSKHNPTSGYVRQERKPLPDDEDEFFHAGKVQQAQDPLEAWASSPKQSECFVALDKVHKTDVPSLSTQLGSKEIYKDDVRTVQIGQIGQTQVEVAEDSAIMLHVDLTLKLDISSLNNECELPSESGTDDQPSQGKGPQKIEGNSSLFERNREKQNEIKRFMEEQIGIILRPGMILPRINDQVGADRPFANDTCGRGDGMSRGRGNFSKLTSHGSGSKHSNHNPTSGRGKFWQVRDPPKAGDSGPKQSECFVASDIIHETDLQSLSTQSSSKEIHVRTVQTGQTQIEDAENSAMLHGDLVGKVSIGSLKNGSELPSKSVSEDRPSQGKGPKKIEGIKDSGHSEHVKPFDICPPETGSGVILKPSLLDRNREKRKEIKRSMEEKNECILRPGMILLRNYLSISDQVKIVNACRDLGCGPGGFYQPGYRDGAKLHLQMMCLGKNWDPETSMYGDLRPMDNAKPPIIPHEFYQLVEQAIKDSHALIERDSKRSKVEDILPWMSPSICIVNFYSTSGRLGLHQDKDERRESLDKRLPVVSFSLGDSAKFLYGDQRDVDKAEKVELKSGDVLIFGGNSRHIFHGVTAILPNTAPKTLLEETNLRPGRLNLTFREY